MAWGQPVVASLIASGKVTGPGAGAAICTIAAANLTAGLYSIQVITEYGSVAGVDFDMQLQAGGVALLTVPIGAANVASTYQPVEIVRKLDGATNLTVNAIAGNAGGIYMAAIIATKIRG